jgi:hypothetical protein
VVSQFNLEKHGGGTLSTLVAEVVHLTKVSAFMTQTVGAQLQHQPRLDRHVEKAPVVEIVLMGICLKRLTR